MRFLGYYCLFSLFLGFVKAVLIVFPERKDFFRIIGESDTKAGDKVLEKNAAAGHIQKEVYGERTVYYRKDLRGEAAVKSVEVVTKFKREHQTLYTAFIMVAGVIMMAITWPRDFYRYLREL